MTPFIETLHLREHKSAQESLRPICALFDNTVDTMVYNESDCMHCVCPQSGKVRAMVYNGFKNHRRTVKYQCPAVEYGLHKHRGPGDFDNLIMPAWRIEYNCLSIKN